MRNKRLDVLRCVAILLVVARHAFEQTRIGAAGWVGVDLFFVLSGFLISGLLFSEYKKTQSINWKRFFIRRGLKLYPAFYVLLVVTLMAQYMVHRVSSFPRFLGELFYVQNYGPHVWSHTWSLAVEEHFYLVLPAILLLLIRLSSDRRDPFGSIPLAFAFVAVACLISRTVTVTRVPSDVPLSWLVLRPVYTATHDRIDSLFFGVLLGYLHHFRPHVFDAVIARKRNVIALGIFAAALLSTCLLVPLGNRFMLTAGFTFLYLGFGIVLILSLYLRGVLPGFLQKPFVKIGSWFAFAGMYSYSIYLWHPALLMWMPGVAGKIIPRGNETPGIAWLCAAITVLFGIMMSRVVEYPVLRIRDRLFPGNRSPVVDVPQVSAIEPQPPIVGFDPNQDGSPSPAPQPEES
jgi:peptidoglycan/LPS O-acetylase OafA/YrhL